MNNYAAFICLIHCLIPNILFIWKKPTKSPVILSGLHILILTFQHLFLLHQALVRQNSVTARQTKILASNIVQKLRPWLRSTISSGSGLACVFFIFFNITLPAEVWYCWMWPVVCCNAVGVSLPAVCTGLAQLKLANQNCAVGHSVPEVFLFQV